MQTAKVKSFYLGPIVVIFDWQDTGDHYGQIGGNSKTLRTTVAWGSEKAKASR